MTLPVSLLRRLLSPDPEVAWVPFAIRKARQIIRSQDIEAVLVTAPPFSSFLIGTWLKQRFPQLRLISDFRDDWLRFYLNDFDFQRGDHMRRRAEKIQESTVRLSDLVVATTHSTLNDIRRRYPQEPNGKFLVVPNGYDPEVFGLLPTRIASHSKVVVTYVGTVYNVCSPRYYLDALDSLPDHVRSEFETRFIGRVADDERRFLEGRKSSIRLLGFMPQEEAVHQMEEADYLLLTVTNDFALAGKMFEYLATGKPVLAISPPDSETCRLIREGRAGWCADPGDPDAIARILLMAYQRLRTGQPQLDPNWELIRGFERPRLASRYGTAIRGLVRGGDDSPVRLPT